MTCSTCASGSVASGASSAPRPARPGPIKTFQGIGYVLDVEGNLGEASNSQSSNASSGSASKQPMEAVSA